MKTSLLSGVVICLLLGMTSISEAQPTTAPTAGAPTTTPARGGGRGRGGAPATEADLAEIATLSKLPVYAKGAGVGDYSVGPDYPPAIEQTVRDNVPKGKIFSFTINTADSKFFTGLNGPVDRAVAVYVPAQAVAGKPLPVIVAFDQYGLRNNQLPTVLDNMIADKRLPVMCAVMIANGGNPGGQRSLEYDTVSAKNADFIEAEIIPRAEKEAGITITKDPEARMSYGGSSGGIAAFTLAWFRPELYHRVLSYSGTFVNLQRNDEVPHGGWEYHENLIPKNPAKPLRVWIHVSDGDNGATTGSSGFRNWVIANKRMSEVLKAKGYQYQFVFSKASGHTDAKVIANTLPQALEFVWKGYPIEGK